MFIRPHPHARLEGSPRLEGQSEETVSSAPGVRVTQGKLAHSLGAGTLSGPSHCPRASLGRSTLASLLLPTPISHQNLPLAESTQALGQVVESSGLQERLASPTQTHAWTEPETIFPAGSALIDFRSPGAQSACFSHSSGVTMWEC